jgi:hypothetical protein
MKKYCAAKGSKRNPDPSREHGFVGDDAGTRAAGRDDPIVLQGFADDGDWRAAAAIEDAWSESEAQPALAK